MDGGSYQIASDEMVTDCERAIEDIGRLLEWRWCVEWCLISAFLLEIKEYILFSKILPSAPMVSGRLASAAKTSWDIQPIWGVKAAPSHYHLKTSCIRSARAHRALEMDRLSQSQLVWNSAGTHWPESPTSLFAVSRLVIWVRTFVQSKAVRFDQVVTWLHYPPMHT